MTRNRLFLAALFTAAAATLYALLGFFALPYLAKNWIVAHVEQRLNHRLTLGEVRFNPFTGVVGIADADLRDASGTALLAWRHLLVDFSLRGLWRRTWTFDAVRIDAPLLRGELRADGTHNFTGLVEALQISDRSRRRRLELRSAASRSRTGGSSSRILRKAKKRA